MLTVRPDVIAYPAEEFFPGLGGVMATEDFWWAIYQAIGPVPAPKLAAAHLAKHVAELAKAKLPELPVFPEVVLLHLNISGSANLPPVPLLIGRTQAGIPILGVLSDRRPS